MTPAPPQPPLVIRPVSPADAEAIWIISRQARVLPTTVGLPSDRLEDTARMIEGLSARDHYFVASILGEVVGLGALIVATGRYRHSAHIYLYVHEAHHRRGVGSALLGELVDLADGWLRLRRLELTVVASNVAARRLYERHGFAIEGTRRDSLISGGEYVDELMMARIGAS